MSSGRDTLSFQHEVEMAVVMAERAGRPAHPAGGHPGQQPQARRGLLPGRRGRRPGRGAARHRQARQDRPRQGRGPADLRGRADRGRRRAVPRPGGHPHARTRPSPTGCRALGVTDALLDEGIDELVAVVEGANARRPGSVVADLRIARGLDYYTGTVYETQLAGFESGRVDRVRRTLRLPGVRRQAGVPRRRDLPRRHATGVRSCSGVTSCSVSRSVPSAVLVAVVDDAHPGRQRGRRRAPAGARDRLRGRRPPRQVRQADQARRSSRDPVRVVPRRRGGDTVKDIRTGEQVGGRCRRPGRPPRRRSVRRHVHAQPGGTSVIRTHQAGTLRSERTPGQQVTLAGWVASRRDHGGVAFLDLRDASGVVQVVVHDPEVAHPLRDEFCVKVVGTVSSRPEGNENPDLPTGAIEVMVEDARGPVDGGAAAVPDRRSRDGGGGDAPASSLPRPAPQERGRRDPHAVEGQPDLPRRAARARSSSRSRRRP